MKIEVSNILLNYEVAGEGKPVLLLHGNGEDLHIFDELVYKLKSEFKVYSIDSRNHGLSSKTDSLSYDVLAEDILGFIKKLNLQDVSIIGFSDGAIISTILAIKEPSLLSKMVLLDLNVSPTDFLPEIYEELLDVYNKTQDPLISLMLNEPTISIDELKTIKTKSLIIAGENDIFLPESFNKIHNAINNSDLLILDGHDHSSYIVNDDFIYPIVFDFLKN